MAATRNQALTAEQTATLAAWRAIALEKMPYMASILFNLRPLNSPGLKTFACDRWFRLYVDFAAVEEWGNQACSEALLHECFHLFATDAERAEDLKGVVHPRTFNLAADLANNDDLVAAGCSTIAEIGMTPSKYGYSDNLTAERYAELLMRDNPADDQSEDGSGGWSGDQDGSGDGPGDPDGEYGGCGSCAGDPAPVELPEDDDAGGRAPSANETERKVANLAAAVEIREAAAKHPGSVPAGLVESAERFFKPSTLPWRQILAASIRRSVASRFGDFDVTYSKRSRRRPFTEVAPGRSIINPGIYSPIPNLVVVRDTSGSMTDAELWAVTSEVEQIAKQVGIRGRELVVIDVDVEVAATRQYKGAYSLNEVAGRGGTDMSVGIAHAAQMRPRPNSIVVITDGYTPWPPERVGIPVVACIVGKAEAVHSRMDVVPSWITAVAACD
jgi:predicted metal-dependent peptidase